MKKGVIIVDFDNWFKKNISDYSDREIEFEFKSLSEELLSIVPEISHIDIRLYGGWYNENVLTNKASELQLKLARISLFPLIIEAESRLIRGKIDLTSTILDVPAHIWTNTVKEKRGISSLRIDKENLTDKCDSNRRLCPPYILRRFTKSKPKECAVNDCLGVHQNIFVRLEQKMVDTMIACDIIAYCKNENYLGILVASEDVDHFPALAMGVAEYPDTSITVAIRNQEIKEGYDQILDKFDLKTTVL